ncbi:hypothetical protein [Streptomyces sp. NPDC002994]|uniref:hypothetical protein n=1 Tax=Streptomyces sp. NPDC002994 TaxID=3154441 RepID=UPI0033BB3DB2
MTTTPRPHRIDALDVPAETVAALVARQKQQRIDESVARLRQLIAHPDVAEQEHQLDPADKAFAQLACAHPEKCSTPDDYPGWTPGGTR